MGSTTKAATSPPASSRTQRVDVAEGDLGRRQERAETVAELGAAVEGEGAGGEPVEGVVGVDDPGPTGGVPGELDGRLDGLGPRVGEEHPLDAVMAAGHQRLGQEAGQQGAVHLDQVGQVGVDGLVQRLLDPGWFRPRAKTPKPERKSR